MSPADPVTEYKLCKRGHVRSPENTRSNGGCKECKKLTFERWKRDHPEYVAPGRKSEEYMAAQRTRANNWHKENSEYSKKIKTDYRVANRHKRQEKTQALSDGYIADKLHIPISQATPGLLELKRNQILFKRALKELKQAIGGN